MFHHYKLKIVLLLSKRRQKMRIGLEHLPLAILILSPFIVSYNGYGLFMTTFIMLLCFVIYFVTNYYLTLWVALIKYIYFFFCVKWGKFFITEGFWFCWSHKVDLSKLMSQYSKNIFLSKIHFQNLIWNIFYWYWTLLLLVE